MSDFDRAAAQLRAVDDAIQTALPGAAKAGGDVFEPELRRRAPRDEGDLESSIEGKAGDRDANAAEYTVSVKKFYAKFVEYGHGGPHPAPAHPFFRPAIDLMQDEIIQIVEGRILDASRSVTG